jgi:hypothetical protein
MARIISYMFSRPVLYVLGYPGVPKPVDGRSTETLCVFNEAVGAHLLGCCIETFLHYAANLTRATYPTFATGLVD